MLNNLPTILEVWRRLGGQDPIRNRVPALWRKTKDRNVSLDDFKGCYFDFVSGTGGGIIDLVMQAQGCSRKDAFRWLAAEFNLAVAELSTKEVQNHTEAFKLGRFIARDATWWWMAKCSELEELKRCIVDAGADPMYLAAVSSELYRTQRLSEVGVVSDFCKHEASDPEVCSYLVLLGHEWEQSCMWAVKKVIAKIRRQQNKEAHAA